MTDRSSSSRALEPRAPTPLAYLMVVNDPDWRAAILPAEQEIGRGDDAAIRLPARFRSVSRRHAAIWTVPRDERIWVRDLESSLGTAVNGVRIRPERPFQILVGDRLVLGAVELGVVPRQDTTGDTPDFDPEKTFGRAAASATFDALTPAELDVVLWMCRGHTDLETIGARLARSPHTVRTQLGAIFRKTGACSRDELVALVSRGRARDLTAPPSGTD